MNKFYRFFETNLGKTFLYILLLIFLLILELNFVGLSIRDKISIGSTLDFSWFSDLIERKLHGLLLGRDFTFTYGPLFQYIYSLPSVIFHVPSFVSVAFAPIQSFFIIFFLLFYLAKNISKNIFEKISYLLFAFIVLGLLTTSGIDAIKALVPIVYSLIFYNTLNKKFYWPRVIIVAFLPTIFGAYTYNLFFTTCLITILYLAFFIVINRRHGDYYKFLFIIPIIVGAQILLSLLLTQNLDYIRYSIDSITNYRYVLDLPWAHDRVNLLLIFPLLLSAMGILLWKTNYVTKQSRNILLVLLFASLIELDYAISRSDAGHLLWALFPSLLTFYTIIFVLAQRLKILFPIAFIFYILFPFKPTFYNSIAPKNIYTVFQIIHKKPNFFSLYKIPEGYYSLNEIETLNNFVRMHKNTVYIYPYDSYLLNIQNTTYNSYALGTYTYSGSSVEEKTVNNFENSPPTYIILGIDTKGTLNLDDIPNFTRNPQLAEWFIKNYSIKDKTKKYLILIYTPKKKINSSCQIIRLTINPAIEDTFTQRVVDIIKPAIYYFGKIRLPYSPTMKSYLLFQNIYTSSGVEKLFKNNPEKNSNLPKNLTNGLTLTRVDPFSSKKQNKYFDKKEYSVQCVQM